MFRSVADLLSGEKSELLTIGSRIKPTHSADKLGFEATRPLILLTRNSAVTPTRTVTTTRTICR
jgi:hypothetical protein